MAAIVATTVSTLGQEAAHACSCVSGHPLDNAYASEVVFTGTLLGNDGTPTDPLWRFEVDGVIKGEVDAVEVLSGEDFGAGCGTAFGPTAEPIVVYAEREGDGLRAQSCSPQPSVESFEAMLAEVADPTGTGPPVAIMVGGIRDTDVALLDEFGRTIANADLGLGHGEAAHCRATSRAVVMSQDLLTVIDLSTLDIVTQRASNTGYLSVADRVACFDGGEHIVTARGFGPNGDPVTVVASEAGGDDLRRSFEGVSRAVIHPFGTVLLLPSVISGSIRGLSAVDLEPVGDDFSMPAGSTTLDGDISPDGSILALLATMSDQSVEWDTGATHMIFVGLAEGVPVADMASVIALTSPGTRVESRNGAANRIRWVDDTTLMVEYETVDAKRVEFVATDGTQILPSTDVGWGWGFVPVESGVLRVSDGGVELLRRDGTTTEGDPAPDGREFHRSLSLAPLVDPPPFEVPSTPAHRLSIRPVVAEPTTDSSGAPELSPTPEVPSTPAESPSEDESTSANEDDDAAAPVVTAPLSDEDGPGRSAIWIVLTIAVFGAVLSVAAWFVISRTATRRSDRLE